MPSISVIIPTYNSERTLTHCLESIVNQDYPREKIEIIIADGGSRDRTLETAKKYKVDKILHNPLVTGETGKAVGVEASENEIIAFIDSDNVLDRGDWLRRMVEPLKDPSIVGSEPLYYTYRSKDPLITRYCALLGMNDPLCLYLANYDKYSYVTGRWTGLPVKTVDKGSYLLVELDGRNIPTIGANGFLIRTEAMRGICYRPYLFDIDIVYQLVNTGRKRFAKVKVGIVHLFAEDEKTYVKKTYRRIRDYLYYKKRGMRKYRWGRKKPRLLKFILFTLLIFPLIRDALKGYRKLPDHAWLFHPIACLITLLVYSSSYIHISYWKAYAVHTHLLDE